MTYVVTESCIRCKYTDCVDVCPVDCFREGPNFLTIDPAASDLKNILSFKACENKFLVSNTAAPFSKDKLV